jgi:hypothetical protein
MFFTRGMTTIISSAPHTATNEAFLALKNFSIIVPGIGSYGIIQTFISFDGTLSARWTKIAIGILLFLFILFQRFLSQTSRFSSKAADISFVTPDEKISG